LQHFSFSFFFWCTKFTAQTSNWPTVSYKSFHFAAFVFVILVFVVVVPEWSWQGRGKRGQNVLPCFSGGGRREMLNGLSKSNFVFGGVNFYLLTLFSFRKTDFWHLARLKLGIFLQKEVGL